MQIHPGWSKVERSNNVRVFQPNRKVFMTQVFNALAMNVL